MKIFNRITGELLLEIDSLRGADLLGADLREADLREADLREADLREADLLRADLLRANLIGADLREADLREANLRGANLLRANLRGANLRGANLLRANLRGAKNILSLGPMDTSGRIIYIVFGEEKNVMIQAGCFWGTLENLKKQVLKSHKSKMYLLVIDLIEKLNNNDEGAK